MKSVSGICIAAVEKEELETVETRKLLSTYP
jgi:hypothetical protein